MTAKMKNALVGSVGLFAIAMAFTLFAIPQASYADQAVDESDALAAADEDRYGWVQDESGNRLYAKHYDVRLHLSELFGGREQPPFRHALARVVCEPAFGR